MGRTAKTKVCFSGFTDGVRLTAVRWHRNSSRNRSCPPRSTEDSFRKSSGLGRALARPDSLGLRKKVKRSMANAVTFISWLSSIVPLSQAIHGLQTQEGWSHKTQISSSNSQGQDPSPRQGRPPREQWDQVSGHQNHNSR